MGIWGPYPKGPSTQLSYTLKNSNLHNYYPKSEYLIIVSFGPLGSKIRIGFWGAPVKGAFNGTVGDTIGVL